MTTTETAPRRGLSIFLLTPPEQNAGVSYEKTLAAIELAERAGFETAWLAEGHFAPIGLPSALTLLAAATRSTSSIRLGTAVVPLVFDSPLRVAETAAVVDALSDGRLELGVGKSNGHGFSTTAFSAFGRSEDDRESLYAAAVAELKQALAGSVTVGGEELPVYPHPGTLADRLWQATGNRTTATEIGRAGDGLLLHRVAFDGDTGTVQSQLIDVFLDAFTADAAPRIGVSRALLVASSREEAVRLIEQDIERQPQLYRALNSSSPADFLEKSNIAYGSPEQVVERLLSDPALVRSTDYLFSTPLPIESTEFAESIQLIADEIYPHLPVAASIGVTA